MTASQSGKAPGMLISIVVVAYNSAATIEETLESCYGQSYRNIEIVVADDGSQDDTVAIVQDVAAKHPEIRTTIVSNPTNRGTTANLKSGLDKAKGTWVKPIAADDTLISTAIEDLLPASGSADVILSHFQSFGAESRIFPTPWTVRCIRRSRNLARSMLMGFSAVAPAAMIRLSVLRKESLPSDDYVFADDSMFYDLATLGYRFAFVDKITVNFRVHDKQITAGNSAASALLRSEQAHGREIELRKHFGALHPYRLHLAYQRALDDLPRALGAGLRLIDPLYLIQQHVNGDLPWQKLRRGRRWQVR